MTRAENRNNSCLIPAKKLGFGMRRLPRKDPARADDVDIEKVKEMVDLFMERGFTYFDIAIMYNGFASEAVVKAALTDRYDRDSFTLADKIHADFFHSMEERETYFRKQMEDNISFMEDFEPLTEEEQALCFKAAEIVNSQIAVPCTSCHYCTEGCPEKIAIPEYFSIYNEDMREHLEEKGWTINFTNYEVIAKGAGKAGQCIGCGQCENICPQHLPVIQLLKDVAAHYEREH